MEEICQGALYLVATPIGNLTEISARTKFILSNVDVILAEDTRHSGKLLQHLDIKAKVWSFHRHNCKIKQAKVIEELAKEKSFALISDAGMPLISDPGHELVQLCHKSFYRVIPVSGPSAVISAAAASGLCENGFSFVGFLPSKQRKQFLLKIKSCNLATVCFEAPHRIISTISDLSDVLPADRVVFIAKEMTKMHEKTCFAKACDLNHFAKELNLSKGELVLVIAPEVVEKQQINSETLAVMQEMQEFCSDKAIALWLNKLTKIAKNELYQALLEQKNQVDK